MAAEIIDGKAIAREIREGLKDRIRLLREQKGVTPCLAVVLVGDDPASKTYVRNKERACNEVGMLQVLRLPDSTSQHELMRLVNELAYDPDVHGILVQLPLPAHLDKDPVLMAVPGKRTSTGCTCTTSAA